MVPEGSPGHPLFLRALFVPTWCGLPPFGRVPATILAEFQIILNHKPPVIIKGALKEGRGSHTEGSGCKAGTADWAPGGIKDVETYTWAS